MPRRSLLPLFALCIQLAGCATGAAEPAPDLEEPRAGAPDDGAPTSEPQADTGGGFKLSCTFASATASALPDINNVERWGMTWTCDDFGQPYCLLPFSCALKFNAPSIPPQTTCTGSCDPTSAPAYLKFVPFQENWSSAPFPKTWCSVAMGAPVSPLGNDFGTMRCWAKVGQMLGDRYDFAGEMQKVCDAQTFDSPELSCAPNLSTSATSK